MYIFWTIDFFVFVVIVISSSKRGGKKKKRKKVCSCASFHNLSLSLPICFLKYDFAWLDARSCAHMFTRQFKYLHICIATVSTVSHIPRDPRVDWRGIDRRVRMFDLDGGKMEFEEVRYSQLAYDNTFVKDRVWRQNGKYWKIYFNWISFNFFLFFFFWNNLIIRCNEYEER